MTQNACLPDCGVARFLTLLNGPWATLVVRELLQGPRRFTELREALPGISPHTLTSRLRQFETYGIVTRTAYAEIPPRVEYELTPLGEGLRAGSSGCGCTKPLLAEAPKRPMHSMP